MNHLKKIERKERRKKWLKRLAVAMLILVVIVIGGAVLFYLFTHQPVQQDPLSIPWKKIAKVTATAILLYLFVWTIKNRQRVKDVWMKFVGFVLLAWGIYVYGMFWLGRSPAEGELLEKAVPSIFTDPFLLLHQPLIIFSIFGFIFYKPERQVQFILLSLAVGAAIIMEIIAKFWSVFTLYLCKGWESESLSFYVTIMPFINLGIWWVLWQQKNKEDE